MSNSKERPKIGVAKERQGQVRTWQEMSGMLSGMVGMDIEETPFDQDHRRFLEKYFHVQKLIAEKEPEQARELFRKDLLPRTGYEEFEESQKILLMAIDIAVKGKSQWTKD